MTLSLICNNTGKPIEITIAVPTDTPTPLPEVWRALIIPALLAAGYSEQSIANLHDQ